MATESTLYGSLTLRPTRIGFLVRPTDLRAIQRIMRLCTCLWGGLFNPIIPVCRALPKPWRDEPSGSFTGPQLTAGYLRFFEPDVFVEASPDLTKKAGVVIDYTRAHNPRVISLDEFVQTTSGGAAEIGFGLPMYDIYADLYEQRFQFAPRQEQENPFVEFLPGGASSQDVAFTEASFGIFPEDAQLKYLAEAFRDVFRPTQLEVDGTSWTSVLATNRATPLSVTKYQITPDAFPPFARPPILFIFNPGNALDLIDFWNLRLFNAEVVAINSGQVRDSKAFLEQYMNRKDPRIAEKALIQFGRSLSADFVDNIRRNVLEELSTGFWFWSHNYEAIWAKPRPDDVASPTRFHLAAGTRDLEFPTVAGESAELQFRSISPEFARFGHNPARWVNVLDLRDYGHRSNVTVFSPTSLQDPHRSRIRLEESLVITTEGFVLPENWSDHREFLELPSGRDAIVDWLGRHGVVATPSDPGRVADEILLAVGGFGGARLIAHKETLCLLDKMAKSVRVASDRIEEYPDRTSSVEKWVALLSRRSGQHMYALDLDDFIQSGALRLGLMVKCRNCEKQNWYGLGELDSHVTCSRCLKTFRFPQGDLDFRRTPWRFRVTGPFSVPDFAAGAYATILSLRVFGLTLALEGENSIVYTTNLNLETRGQSMEVDFAFWYRRMRKHRYWEEPVFCVGEAKSFASAAFQPKQVNRLKTLVGALPGSVLLFAVLKDRLSASEKKLVSSLAYWGRVYKDGRQRSPVIVLTGTELFAESTISDSWLKRGGKHARLANSLSSRRLDELDTLADLTQQLYLDMPSYKE